MGVAHLGQERASTCRARCNRAAHDGWATAENLESVDLLELAGASTVLSLKQRLGEQLANRVESTASSVHVIGNFKNLLIGEFPIYGTELAGRTLAETMLRQRTGVNVVGMWERGQLRPVKSDTVLDHWSIPVVVCSSEQIDAINDIIRTTSVAGGHVIVLGGGKVGQATAISLKNKGLKVNLIERDPVVAARFEGIVDQVFVGEAADRDTLERAGIAAAQSVVLTTNDDSTNAYLCIYFRKLKPEIRIVSRITHERNIESIHRAGADFVLSYSALGQESVLSIIQGREFVFLGSDVDFHVFDSPRSMVGRTLRETNIGARTGMNVIGMQIGENTVMPGPDTEIVAGSSLIAMGTAHQVSELMKRVGTFIHKTPPWDEYGRGSSGCQAGVKVSKSGIGTNAANAGDATGAAGMVGTDRWMVPEAGLWGAGGRLALENVRKW